MKVRYFLPLSLLFLFIVWKKLLQPRIEADKILEKGKTLEVFSNSPIASLDPIMGTDVYSVQAMSKVYEGLYEYHYLKRPFTLSPNLAEAMPEVSEDRLTYTIKIRKDVYFQDDPCFENGKGRLLTAHDFIYSWKRLLDPKNAAKQAWILDGKIEGFDAWQENRNQEAAADYDTPISGLQATDDYTLKIKLVKPSAQFVNFLTMTPTFVVAKEAIEYYKDDFNNHLVGTGPFAVESYNPNDNKIVYVKNKKFRKVYFPTEGDIEFQKMIDQYGGKQMPFVDKIVTNIVAEEQPRWLQFQKKKADYIDLRGGTVELNILEKNHQLKQEYKDKGMKIFTKEDISVGYTVFNTQHELFKNKKLRQAISLAFDRDKQNTIFSNGRSSYQHTTIPKGFAGHDPDYKAPYGYFDLLKAKQLLQEAGYPEGKGLPKITYNTSIGVNSKKGAEFLQQNMKAIGIDLVIVQDLFPQLIEKTDKGATMMHGMAWSPDYPDAETFLSLFYSKGELKRSYGKYDNSIYDAMYEQASKLEDGPERTKLYKKMAEHIAENVPVIVSMKKGDIYVYHDYVKNLIFTDFHAGLEKYVDIDILKKHKK